MKRLFTASVLSLALATPSLFAGEVAEPAAEPTAEPLAEAVAAPQQSGWKDVLSKLPKISGYLQTGWNYTSDGYGATKEKSSFQAKRLRLIMDGNVGAKVSFRLQIEAFNGIAGSTNGNGQKNIQVMDAFATAKITPAFQIRAGQFYTPMGYENYDISPATLETVDFSNICYRMACRNAISYNFVDYGRDLGVMILGDVFPTTEGYSHLHYDLAITNGGLPCKDDNNNSKDIYAALNFKPIKNLSIKGSFNWGEYAGTVGDKTYQYQPMTRFIVGAWYNDPTGIDLRAEFGMQNSKDNGVSIVKETGAYVLAGYHAGKFLPVVRWDMYKDDVNKVSANNYNRVLVGCTYQALSNLKVQLNYGYTFYNDEAKKVSEAAGGKSGQSQIQLMGLFKF